MDSHTEEAVLINLLLRPKSIYRNHSQDYSYVRPYVRTYNDDSHNKPYRYASISSLEQIESVGGLPSVESITSVQFSIYKVQISSFTLQMKYFMY